MAVCTGLVLLYLLLLRQLVTGSTCISGYFLSENKQCIACPDHCLDCDSGDYCLYCEKGYWGKICELSCPNCMIETSCEKTNGFCKEGCAYGYSGLLCNIKCDNKCYSCNRENPQNCSKCAPARYQVPYCDNICSGCHEQNCDETGICALSCVDGFWGQRCEEKCSENCMYPSCDRDNGTCIDRSKENSTGLQYNKTNSNITEKNSTPEILVVAAAAVAAIALVGVVIACSVLCFRRIRKKNHRDSQPEEEGLVPEAEDRKNDGASRSTDILQPIRICLQNEKAYREIHETLANLFDCLSNCIGSLLSLDDSSGSTEEIKSFESAKTLQENVVTLLKNHARSWKAMLSLLVDDFPLPKSDSYEIEETEYMKHIEENCQGTYNKTYTKLLLYASATCINTPIYVISFDQQWHYFEPLFTFHEQPKRILRYITMCVCPDNLFYKIESTDPKAMPPKATGLVGMYKQCLEDTPTFSISVPVELTKMLESSKIDLCESVGEDVISECWDFLLETKLINEEEYTSLTTEINRTEDFCSKITGSEDAFEKFCKVLIKRRPTSILSPYIETLSLSVTSYEYLSQYKALYLLDSAIVKRNVSMKSFCHACTLVESELNDTSSAIASIPGHVLRISRKWVGAVWNIGRGVAAGTGSVVDEMKGKIKLKDIEEMQKSMHDMEFKISTEMENVEKLFKTAYDIDHKSARLGTTAAAVSAAVLGPLSLVFDIAALSEAAHNKRKGDKTDAGEMLQSMIDIVEVKCKIFNNMLRGHFEDEKIMF